MKAKYFMGCYKGTSKEKGTDFYSVTLLFVNGFGNWQMKSFYTTPEIFGQIQRENIIPGVPVFVEVFEKSLEAIAVNRGFEVLPLGSELVNPDKKN